MLRKQWEILDTGYVSHTVDAATGVQSTRPLGGQASTYPATVLACQSRGTLTSTPADGRHRGSTRVHADTAPVLKSPLQKASLQVEFGCIPGNELRFGKEMQVKGEKTVGVWALPLGSREPGCCSTSGSQPVPRTLPGALEGRLCIKSWQHIPMEGFQAALHSPPDSGNTSSVDPWFQFQPKKAAEQKPEDFPVKAEKHFPYTSWQNKTTTTKEPQNAMLVH